LQQTAAVDDDASTCDEFCAGKIGNGGGDVVRGSHPLQDRLSGAARLLLGLDCDGARRDAADADLGRKRLREHARQHRLRRLGAAVGGERRPRLIRRHVLDHHDDPAGGSQVRDRRLRDEEAALRRRAERRVPVFLRKLCDRLRDEAFAGAVHEQVEPAQLLRRTRDQRLRRLRLRDVSVCPPGGNDRPALAFEARGNRRAHAPGAAGNEGA
jgi:hypothetical protein